MSWFKVGMTAAATGLLAVSLATGQVGSSGRDRWECADLADYQNELVMSAPATSTEMWKVIESDDWDDVRLREYRVASEQFEDWADDLNTDFPDVPRAAREYHMALIDVLYLMADVSYVLGSGSGAWGLIGMTEQMETATINMNMALELGNERCPKEWPFGTPDYSDDATTPGSLGRREEAA